MAQPAAEFTAIYRAHANDVLRFALYLSGDRAEAEDITSETFVAAWTTPTAIVAETVKAYLFTIARNLYAKRRKRDARHVALDESLPDTMPSAVHGVEHREALTAISARVARFPDADRTAFLMRVDGDSYEDIAAALGITVGAARVKVHRVRAALSGIR